MSMSINYTHSHIEDIPQNAQVYLCNSMIHFAPVTQIDQHSYSLDEAFEKEMRISYLNTDLIHN